MSDEKDSAPAPVKTEINISGGLKVNGEMTQQGADRAADQVSDGIRVFLRRIGIASVVFVLLYGAASLIAAIAPNGLIQ